MDAIGNLLTNIRNAAMAGKDELLVNNSKMNQMILNIFKSENIISRFIVVNRGRKIKVTLNPEFQIHTVRRISKPGRRVYSRSKDIPRPLAGMGLVVISTPLGVMTGREARKKGLGGELICEVW